MKQYYFNNNLKKTGSKKGGKYALLEKIIHTCDLFNDFYSIMYRMDYKNPKTFISFLKKNSELICDKLLERIVIEYEPCSPGQGDAKKAEKFKLLMNYYSLSEDYGDVMVKLNYSKPANFDHFIEFSLADKFDALRKSKHSADDSLWKTFEYFNLSDEAKGLLELTKDEGSIFGIWKERGSVHFHYFLNQLKYAQRIACQKLVGLEKLSGKEKEEKITPFLEKNLSKKALMNKAGVIFEWSFDKLLKRTMLNN